MALGATRSRVVGMVMLNACVLVAFGLIIGGVSAWYLSSAAGTFLFRLERSGTGMSGLCSRRAICTSTRICLDVTVCSLKNTIH